MNNTIKVIICGVVSLIGLIPNHDLIIGQAFLQKSGLFITFVCLILMGFYAGNDWGKSE